MEDEEPVPETREAVVQRLRQRFACVPAEVNLSDELLRYLSCCEDCRDTPSVGKLIGSCTHRCSDT